MALTQLITSTLPTLQIVQVTEEQRATIDQQRDSNTLQVQIIAENCLLDRILFLMFCCVSGDVRSFLTLLGSCLVMPPVALIFAIAFSCVSYKEDSTYFKTAYYYYVNVLFRT